MGNAMSLKPVEYKYKYQPRQMRIPYTVGAQFRNTPWAWVWAHGSFLRYIAYAYVVLTPLFFYPLFSAILNDANLQAKQRKMDHDSHEKSVWDHGRAQKLLDYKSYGEKYTWFPNIFAH